MNHPLALIIEDDPDVADLFCHALGLIGFRPELVENPVDAFLKVSKETPALILLDLRLGNEFSGPDLLKKIRETDRMKGVPVIVISGYPRIAEGLVDEADFVLLKPVDLRQLMGLALRIQNQDGKALTPFGSVLLDADSFFERLAFNCKYARRKTDHLFPLLLFSVQLPSHNGEKAGSFSLPGRLTDDIASRIMRRTRSADSVCRHDDNCFSVMLYGIKQPENAVTVAERVIGALEEPFLVDGELLRFQAHAGIALFDEKDPSPEQMISRARSALEDAVSKKQKFIMSVKVDAKEN